MRVDRNMVLNQHINAPSDSADLPAQLAHIMGELKAAAIGSDGHTVDYGRLSRSDVFATLHNQVTAHLRSFDLSTLSSRTERIAFWIDLYNVLVIDGVVSFAVQESVTEGWLGIMSFFRRAAYNVGGHRYSCDDIEHGILRGNCGHPYLPGPHFRSTDPRRAFIITPVDPRIHFALNCASRSCPPIRAYEAAVLDGQLDLAAKAFLSAEVQINRERGQVSLPAIFRWFQGDFGGERGVLAFLLEHMPQSSEYDWLAQQQRSARFTYRPHNWTLNREEVSRVSTSAMEQAPT
jgi:hypothetical protein